MAKRTEIIGLKELESSIRNLGKLPQKTVNRAAKAGSSIAFKAAKGNAPVDEGTLRSALIMRPERTTKAGKKVFNVLIDPSKSALFVKISKKGKRSFYPVSQEYGFFTVNGRYIPGYRYFLRALTENKDVIESKMIGVLSQEIDKELRKGGK